MKERDIAALRFIGQGYEVAQYVLHEAIFADRTDTVVSRFVVRARHEGLIAAQRLGGFGMNRLRLTTAGRRFLIAAGHAHPDELFTPTKWIAAKDFIHHYAINDTRVALLKLGFPNDLCLPAWALQRRLTPTPAALPDVLAIRGATADSGGMLVAVEIDLGGEGLGGIFLPKLTRLAELLRNTAADATTALAIFSRGTGRIASLERVLATRRDFSRWAIYPLPDSIGRRRIAELAAALHSINS